jgi:hypothetical protein
VQRSFFLVAFPFACSGTMCHYYLNFVCYGIASVLESNERVWRLWSPDAMELVFVDSIATALVGISLLRTMEFLQD